MQKMEMNPVKMLRKLFFLVIILALAYFAVVNVYKAKSKNVLKRFNSSLTGIMKSVTSNQKNKPHIVLGSLSISRELRDAQRRTFLTTIKELKDELPFRVTHEFLIDNHTEETDDENRTHGDLFFMNTRSLGYGKKFGEKIHRWFKHVNDKYPDAQLVVKMDDDTFLCVPQVFWRLYNITSPRVYYGWMYRRTRTEEPIGKSRRMDGLFVGVGGELIQRIAARKFCGNQCDKTRDLVNMNWEGVSIANWLSIYNDVDIQSDNDRIFFMGRGQETEIPKYVDENTCNKYVVFHKSSVEIMHQLHTYNNAP